MLYEFGTSLQSARAFAEISFDLSRSTIVSVTIEDAERNVVEVLIEGMVPNGHHNVVWSGTLSREREFFVVVDTATIHQTQRGKQIGGPEIRGLQK